MIVNQQGKKIQQNVNPLTDYVARKAAKCDDPDCKTLGQVSKKDYDEAAKETFEKIGTKPSKFLTEPFKARIPNKSTSGSVTDDMLEALKGKDKRLDKKRLDEFFQTEKPTKQFPLVTKKSIQAHFAIEANERVASEAAFGIELNNLVGNEVINKDKIVNDFVGTIEELRKVKTAAEGQLNASNKGDLVSAILDLIELALLKEATQRGTNQNLKELADKVLNLLQQPLTNKFENLPTQQKNSTDIEIIKETVAENITETSTLDKGFQEANAELEKWKKLPLLDGVVFVDPAQNSFQQLKEVQQMQNIGIDGDRAIVGDPANNIVYFFEYKNDSWERHNQNRVDPCVVLTGKPKPNHTRLVDRKYGYSVGIDGTTAIVGAPMFDIPTKDKPWLQNNGTFCILRFYSNGWFRESYGISFEKNNARIGHSVSIGGKNNTGDGAVAIVGAPQMTTGDKVTGIHPTVGAFYTMIRYGATRWSEDGPAEYPKPAIPYNNFASAVSTDGQTALIGAFSKRGIEERNNPVASGPALTWQGDVYFYRRTSSLSTHPRDTTGNGWAREKVQPFGPSGNSKNPWAGMYRVGYSVSVHGDTAIFSMANRYLKSEYVLVFKRVVTADGPQWKFIQQIDLENSFRYPFAEFTSFAFSTSLAFHGDTFIVGIKHPNKLNSPSFTQEVRIYQRNSAKTKNPWELDKTFKGRGGRAVGYKGGKFLIASDNAVWSYAP